MDIITEKLDFDHSLELKDKTPLILLSFQKISDSKPKANYKRRNRLRIHVSHTSVKSIIFPVIFSKTDH